MIHTVGLQSQRLGVVPKIHEKSCSMMYCLSVYYQNWRLTSTVTYHWPNTWNEWETKWTWLNILEDFGAWETSLVGPKDSLKFIFAYLLKMMLNSLNETVLQDKEILSKRANFGSLWYKVRNTRKCSPRNTVYYTRMSPTLVVTFSKGNFDTFVTKSIHAILSTLKLVFHI